MSNKNLDLKQLQILKEKAVLSVIEHGLTQSKACKIFGFSPTSMCKYIKEYIDSDKKIIPYKKRGVKPRTHCKLSQDQENKLKDIILSRTPDQQDIQATLWNSKVIQQLVEKDFNTSYSTRGIRDLLQRLGFSSQKPIKKAYEQNPINIQNWLEVEYPKIKVRAMQERARIYWADEMGIQSEDNRGRSYGLKGEKPVIRKSGSRFKCNMLAAISPQGFMNWMVFKDNCTSSKFIEFMRRMIRQINQKIFLIVDNLKVHHSKKVREFVEKNKEKICLFYLPAYSPDLNPQELVNQDVKANANNFRALKSLDDLMINIRYYLTKIQFNPCKIMNFFNKKEVRYASYDYSNNLSPA